MAYTSDDIDSKREEALIAEIQSRYDYASREWEDVRNEGRIDIRCVAGNPWDPREEQSRRDANRPCLKLDELGQYVNQLINEVRQHKRSIKVSPVGNKSKEPIARLRGNLIRQIEYRSNAQNAYTTMFENAVQRSYGFLRIKPRYEHVRSFHQELIIEPFQNPDMVTPDPDDLSPTGADMKYAFVHEWWNMGDFRRRWPQAKVKGVEKQWEKDAPKWWRKDRIQVAEYWTIEPKGRELLQLQMPNGPDGKPVFVEVFADEMVMPADDANPEVKRRWLRRFGAIYDAYAKKTAGVLNQREVEYPYVCQYMTNGIELLPPNPERPKQLKNPWMGTSIPIVACYGKILWVDEAAGKKAAGEVVQEDGSGATRKILSLVRLARDPQMLYCYYRTCEAELVGMTPKTPFIGYVGQFRTRSAEWGKVNHEPQAYLEADPMVDGVTGQVLPLPQRQPYDPPIQPLEMGAESARRAIQAAMGIMPLPTSAQRQNEKSGVALKQIETSSQQGSFHFVDHYEMSITECGKKLDELLDDYYDAARDVTVRDAAGETKTVRINDPQAEPDEETGEPLMLTDDPYDVTLSTGPDFASEREQAQDFADQLVGNIQGIAGIIGPQASASLLSLVVKLRNLGPIGDQIAEMLSPDKDKLTPEQLMQQVAQAKQIIEALQQELAQAKQIIETKQIETAGKVQADHAKAQTDAQLAAMKAQTDAQLAAVQQMAETQAQLRELEVKLEIELAKIGSAQALARGEQEMQQLHHHDEMTMRAQENATAEAQATLDRQAAQEQAEKDRQAAAVADEPSAGV